MIQFNSLPIDGPLRITSKFGPRDTGISGASKNHMGIDLGRDKSKAETNLLSAAEGTVLNNYWSKYRGWVIVIQHDGFQTLYQHLKSQSPLVVGTAVRAGTVLGVMGNSSDISVLTVAVHLHFELIVDGKRLDPQPYLENIQPEQSYLKEATEIAGQIAAIIKVNDIDLLISALNDVYNGSTWWAIKKLLDKLGIE